MSASMSMKFEEFCAKKYGRIPYQPPTRLITLDPGETTGYALFVQGKLKDQQQLATKDIEKSTDILAKLFTKELPDIILYEDYKVYGWKSEQHSWASLHTPQLIGTIRTLARYNQIPVHTNMAQMPKQFVTDEKLKQWGYYIKGQKHARDAIRHGCYFLLFNLIEFYKAHPQAAPQASPNILLGDH